MGERFSGLDYILNSPDREMFSHVPTEAETNEITGKVLDVREHNEMAIVMLGDMVFRQELAMDLEGLNPRRQSFLQKLYIYQRDHMQCVYRPYVYHSDDLMSFGMMSPDHVLPFSRGGKTRVNNLVSSCKPCNMAKGPATPEEYIERLAQPDGRAWRAHRWNSFLQEKIESGEL